MNTKKSHVVLLLAPIVLLLAGCTPDGNTTAATTTPSTTPAPSATPTTSGAFSYSDGIDDNGYWEGIKATDYVTLPNYNGLEVPAEEHVITDADVETQTKEILDPYSTTTKVTDRAVVDGDTVNIDYVGSIGGVPFDGGNTNGAGTDVTIGVTQYIDNFLQQLIGHKPGETFDINVTFPADYSETTLAGKAAVFVTTINNITDKVYPEVTDAFVAENLATLYKWTTAAEMSAGIRADLDHDAVQNYLYRYVINNSTVPTVPDSLLDYQIQVMLAYYQNYADQYQITLEEFLATYVGYSSTQELITANNANNTANAGASLIIQAIAEEQKIKPNLDDVAAYFDDEFGNPDYSEYETSHGLPYIMQTTLTQMIVDYLTDHAVVK